MLMHEPKFSWCCKLSVADCVLGIRNGSGKLADVYNLQSRNALPKITHKPGWTRLLQSKTTALVYMSWPEWIQETILFFIYFHKYWYIYFHIYLFPHLLRCFHISCMIMRDGETSSWYLLSLIGWSVWVVCSGEPQCGNFFAYIAEEK